jgi:hypothetical protein
MTFQDLRRQDADVERAWMPDSVSWKVMVDRKRHDPVKKTTFVQLLI